MSRRFYKSEAIILLRRNYSEADRILYLFTRNYGKLAVLAKGVRKPKSRKRGHLEVFSHINFSAAATKGLPIVTEVETVRSNEDIKNNLKKVSLGYYFVEVIEKLTREEEQNIELYSLLLDCFAKLKTAQNLKTLRVNFAKQALTISGFWPSKKPLLSPDETMEEVLEREIRSINIGKKVLGK